MHQSFCPQQRLCIRVRDWLSEHSWDDIFHDLDPECGIAAGERCKDALKIGRPPLQAVLGASLAAMDLVEAEIHGRG